MILDARFLLNRPSGIGTYTLRLFQHIPEINAVIVSKNDCPIYFLDSCRQKGVYIYFSDIHPMSFFSFFTYLKIFLHKKRKAIFLYPQYSVPIFFWKFTIPVIHDLFPITIDNYFIKFKSLKRIHFILSLYLLKFVPKIIYVSETTKCLAHNKFNHLSLIKYLILTPIPIPINFKYRPKKLNFNEPLVLTYIGDLRPHKNIKFVIYIFKILSSIYNLKLVIAGPLDIGKHFLESELNTDFIEILGTITESEKELLLDKTDFFINLSFDEGFGIPVHEAAERGCRLILSDINVFKYYCLTYSPFYVDVSNFDSSSFILNFHNWINK